MSLERELKEAFERHASDVREDPSSLRTIEGRVVRSHRTRAVAVITASVAVLAGAVVAAPKLLGHNGPQKTPFANPSASSSVTEKPSAGPSPTNWTGEPETLVASGDRGYGMAMPDSWRTFTFEGHDEYFPKALGGLESGEDTFAIDISLEFADYKTQIDNPTGETDVAGRRALYVDDRREPNRFHYAVDWTDFRGCNGPPACDTKFSNGPKTLNIRISGSTDALWDTYQHTAFKMIASLFVLKDFAVAETATPHDLLVKFLTGRVANTSQVNGLLAANAKAQYDAHEGGLGLLEWTHDGLTEPYTKYRVVSEDQADANSIEAVVEMWTNAGIVYERLGVGPGAAWDGHEIDFVIRFAMVIEKPQ